MEPLQRFIEYASRLRGDEKGEAQVFCDRLFQAFGHPGYHEAGAVLEFRVKRRGRGTGFADLHWESRLLLEMKRRGENLQRHYQQAFEYWLELTPKRPKYVVLCNFDEFWIYDLDLQLYEPVDRIRLVELAERYTALNFLFPGNRQPQFRNNLVDVTRAAAHHVACVFNSIVEREPGDVSRKRAQRFILQAVVAMFAEDCDLLPRGLFSQLLDDCRKGRSTYDHIGGLFRQMNSQSSARGGLFRDVAYFNGGLFETIDPIELNAGEIELMAQAADEKWFRVNPAIFGTIFQDSMDADERHAYGAHFTSEADIQKVVLPTIVRPWRERIESAASVAELRALAADILDFTILDPACGSGNFLYVAYRELLNLELDLLTRIHARSAKARESARISPHLSVMQFFGIDNNDFAVELAKVTLMLAKRTAFLESSRRLLAEQHQLPYDFESALPLDNLDGNIVRDDALFCVWPNVDAIIGNPPYQSKNKMQQEYGRAYLNRLRDQYPDIPGRADYCVYWFRRAHDHLAEGKRAGLVGTNTVRQNESREASLDYILKNGGTITEAVSTQVWSGEAAVHVSIVNWVKGTQSGKKKLLTQLGDDIDSPWRTEEMATINAALTSRTDVTAARILEVNRESDTCDQGQTHGHEGFLMSWEEGTEHLRLNPEDKSVLWPYMTADELIGSAPPRPKRFVIDFDGRDVNSAQQHRTLFHRVKKVVLPARESAEEKERTRNEEARREKTSARVNRHHHNFLEKWWLLGYPRDALMAKLARIPRYIVCGRVTKRPIFEFVSRRIHPNDALQVFTFADDYSFGILQSRVHWEWFKERCSTLKGDFRYTSDTVYDTFPWPQDSTLRHVQDVAKAAVALRRLRGRLLKENECSYRDLYRTLELPGRNPLKQAHDQLDIAVKAAYGMRPREGNLAFLLNLNAQIADRESQAKPVVGPGLPPCVKAAKFFITADCITSSKI